MSEMTIVGTLIEVGGEPPELAIEVGDRTVRVINIDPAMAIWAGKFLFTQIRIRIDAVNGVPRSE